MIRIPSYTSVILLLFVILFAGSCTIQKRVHRKGWFVQWNHSNSVREIDSKGIEVSAREKKVDNNPFEKKAIEFESEETANQNVLEVAVLESKELHSIRQAKTDFEEDQSENSLETKTKKRELSDNSRSDINSPPNTESLSPPRIPLLAWALLIIGCVLLGIAIVLGLVYLAANGALIGAPLYIGLVLLAGILFIVWATQTALAPFNAQPSPPDPRFEKEEPKKEKKEREPLKKNDKIFLAVVAGLVVIIAVSLLSY